MPAISALSRTRRLLAAAVLALVASCGGDGFSPEPRATAAQRLADRAGRTAEVANFSAAASQRLRALSARADSGSVEVSDDALDLFEFAEAEYDEYFPSTQPNQRYTDEYGRVFSYRFYPETGAYLGVDDTSRVYVLGGPFGAQITFVGQVSDHLPQSCRRVATGFDLEKLDELPGGDGGGTDGGGTGAGSGEGAIRDADVSLYDANGVRLGTARSDGQGLARLKACGAIGPFRIEFVGNDTAQYFDEAVAVRDGEAAAWLPFPATERLSAWVEDLNSHHVVVSPLTHAATQALASDGLHADRATALRALPGGSAGRVAAMSTAPTSGAIRDAHERVRTALNERMGASGFSVDDITRTPMLAYSLDSLRAFDGSARGRYGLLLATLAKSAAAFDPGLASPAREMSRQLAHDLADGAIDGVGRGGTAVETRAFTPAQLAQSIGTNARGRLSLRTIGSGEIKVMSSTTAATTCAVAGGNCFALGTTVTLGATPAAGYEFKGWFGLCDSSVSRPSCKLTMSGDRAVAANFVATSAPKVTLSIEVQGMGGMVLSQPTGIACASDCAMAVAQGAEVLLAATSPSANAVFTGWTGACEGQGRTCRLTMDAARSATAVFAASYRLTLSRSGSGVVTASPRGVPCGEGCQAYRPGTPVMLVATPSADSYFTGWSGEGCSGRSTCTVEMTASRQVSASFRTALQLKLRTTGKGTLSPSPVGVYCGDGCWSYAPGTTVVVSASPLAGSSFSGWSSTACKGTGPCTLTLSTSQTLTGTFSAPVELAVAVTGTGKGVVTSMPAGIDCPATCTAAFAAGTPVTLTATPTGGSAFNGWSLPECPGTGPCTVSLASAKRVEARFGSGAELTIGASGTGSGTIISSPAGISCPGTCTAEFPLGVPVTLTATAAAGSTLSGWSDPACAGTSCTITLTGPRSLTAAFDAQGFTLTVSRAGAGSGTVTSQGREIDCGSTCSRVFATETTVVLTATPGSASRFAGWSGGCSGTGNCTVTMSRARSVTATFERTYTLEVLKAGKGSGVVTSSPSRIDCGLACSASFTEGTPVSLVATASPGSVFAGWTGACSGTGLCTVTMSTARQVTAVFDLGSTDVAIVNVVKDWCFDEACVLVYVDPGTLGTVTSNAGGLNCGDGCSGQVIEVPAGVQVTFTATPAVGVLFERWHGICEGVTDPVCTRSLPAGSWFLGVEFNPFPDF